MRVNPNTSPIIARHDPSHVSEVDDRSNRVLTDILRPEHNSAGVTTSLETLLS